MIGKEILEIGPKEFLEGMTTSPETDDGGFSPETNAVNVLSTSTSTGVLYAASSLTNKATPSGNIIATCSDEDSGLGAVRYALTDTGRFYSISTSYAATLRQTTGGGITYGRPNSDIITYKNCAFATSAADVTIASGANMTGTFNEAWWTSTLGKAALTSGVPHPLLVFEDYMWIGDANKLHRTDGTTGDTGFLTLPTGQTIISLAVDPASGLMVISVSGGPNGSSTLPRTSKILFYDGYSSKVRKAVSVDNMVSAMYVMGGAIYMFYGRNLGYWNGSGITFLMQLTNITESGSGPVYKHWVTGSGRMMYFADGVDIVAYGDGLPGKKRAFVACTVTQSINAYLESIFALGNNNIGIGSIVTGPFTDFSYFDTTAKTAGSLDFYSKKYKFSRPIQVREIVIEYADSVANGATPAQLYLIDQEKTQIATYPLLSNDSGGALYKLRTKYNGPRKFYTLQVRYENSSHTSVIAGVRRILVSYDYVE